MISAVVLTKDEEKNLPDCLESIKWVDEIIIIDDYSSDGTIGIIREIEEIGEHKGKIKIFKRRLAGDFAAQRNYGLRKAKGEWVLFVDADERVSPELAAEIKKEIKNTKVDGFYFKRQDFFGGRALKYGETANVRLLRLGRKGKGEWRREVHEVWEIKGETEELKNPVFHYPHQALNDFIEHINFHSTLHAQALQKEGLKPSLLRIIFNPKAKFIQNYIFRLGFLDGTPGIIAALMMSFHSFLAQAKLYFLWKK